jgi:hypothetical protein
MSNTTGPSSGAGIAYPSRANEFTPVSCFSIFSFLCSVFSFDIFSFGHCAVSPSLCYLQTFPIHAIAWFRLFKRGRRGRDRMTFGFVTTYASSTYHH